MEIRIVREIVPKEELAAMAEAQFGDFVKAVVDVEQGIMAIGGDLMRTKKRYSWIRALSRRISGGSICTLGTLRRIGSNSIP